MDELEHKRYMTVFNIKRLKRDDKFEDAEAEEYQLSLIDEEIARRTCMGDNNNVDLESYGEDNIRV